MENEHAGLGAQVESLLALDAEIDEAERALKELKQQREASESLLVEMFAAHGIQNMRVGDRTVYLARELYVSVPAANRPMMLAALRAEGCEDVIETTVSTARLKSLIREWIGEEGSIESAVPADIRSAASIVGATRLRTRKV